MTHMKQKLNELDVELIDNLNPTTL